MGTRQVIEGRQYQGVDEAIAYAVTTTPWGSEPTSVSVKAYDLSTNKADVSSTVLSGTPSVAGDVITLPLLTALVDGHRYRVEVKWVSSGNTFECWFEVQAEW